MVDQKKTNQRSEVEHMRVKLQWMPVHCRHYEHFYNLYILYRKTTGRRCLAVYIVLIVMLCRYQFGVEKYNVR